MNDSWDDCLEEADEISTENISLSSKKTYASGIRVYERVVAKYGKNPYPITIENMRGFLISKKKEGRTYNTLHGYISAFNNYFEQNLLPNLTKDIQFKNFKSGLRRVMQGNNCPKAKLPFDVNWFNIIPQYFNLNQMDDRLFFFYMTLSFSGFLRISELLNLQKKDLELSNDNQILTLYIKNSKTDQFGRGCRTFIYNNETSWSPINFLDTIEKFNDDDYICHLKEHALRSHLIIILKQIGIPDAENYSWHSFRRGGAYQCGLNGTPDYLIKAHGRWKSSAYIRYVSVDMSFAGQEIAKNLK